jgi:hypothetical protein
VDDTYTVEVLNLGKRPVAGVEAGTTAFDDQLDALDALYRAIGELVLHRGLSLLGAEHRDEVGRDGIMAAARLSHETEGGRVEVLLRRRPGPQRWSAGTSAEDGDDDA